ncbi:hypothetical protein SsS58_05644 [Streptomyces scabiei]|uniref:DDE domain-containing protein n=1 Tax=Streptomyces scabiei TaxID=1930 RepID=A0A100JT68_STRSC|nr:hypothetical protein SsS58_05644 [Streptomyces scabiei]
MPERPIVVSYETIRRRSAKFGQAHAGAPRRRQPRPGDKRHLDEVFIKIDGGRKHLRQAVDQDGDVLDIRAQKHRDKAAARRSLRRRMKRRSPRGRVVLTPSGGLAVVLGSFSRSPRSPGHR